MDRKTLIKNLREIIRNLRDESLFSDDDFIASDVSDFGIYSRADNYICKKLNYPLIVKFIEENQHESI